MSIVRKELEKISPYIPGRSAFDIVQETGISDFVKLSSNENPLGASKMAIFELTDSVAKISEYPDSNSTAIRGLLAGRAAVSFESVIMGCGSNEVMEMVTKTFLRPGDVAVTSEMTFSLYERFTTLMGSHMVTVPLKDFGYDLKEIANQVVEKSARLVFLANPNNPTGSMLSKEEIVAFMDELPGSTIVIFDEAYIEYANPARFSGAFNMLSRYPNIIAVRTFSKAYGLAGLRVGYGVADERIITEMRKTTQPFNTSSLAQIAAASALCDKDHILKTIELNNDGKIYLYDFFESNNIWYLPTEANFILFDTGIDGDAVYEALIKEGVIIRHIKDNYLRVSIGTMRQNKLFSQAMKKVYDLLSSDR